jgi:hypothetical protein
MTAYAPLLDRVDSVADLLSEEARTDARRVVAIGRALVPRPRALGKLIAESTDVALKRELGRLTELLGRRSTQALPAAALGRTLLADLAGDLTSMGSSSRECEAKLALLGY